MKPLFVLALIFVTAIAFAQNEPTAEQRCPQIVRLEAEVGELLVKYTENHPEVVKLREEIKAQRTELQKPGYVCRSQLQGAGIVAPRANVTQPNVTQPNARSLGCSPGAEELDRNVRVLRERIALMRQRYTENHPEVQRAGVHLASVEVQLAQERARAESQGLDCSAVGEPVANSTFVRSSSTTIAPASSACAATKFLHTQVERYAWLRQKQLQLGHTEQHPEVQAVNLQLASLEARLAAEKARAASQGLDCSATDLTTRETQHP